MATPKTKRVYREAVTGPSKRELSKAPVDWSPLADYRAANLAGRAPSVGSLLQLDAVRSTCPCPDCTARRSAA
ncbi:hypothetical protein [Kitasatospora sp. MBT66]|uniref:hypothetical protein n=1 Tax=Kitasatospora sp. MBT66 TaxID=1444769 RepID=UPI0005BADAF6|nr:hypothetical protein [Kitasatospora sp. MBT66]